MTKTALNLDGPDYPRLHMHPHPQESTLAGSDYPRLCMPAPASAHTTQGHSSLWQCRSQRLGPTSAEPVQWRASQCRTSRDGSKENEEIILNCLIVLADVWSQSIVRSRLYNSRTNWPYKSSLKITRWSKCKTCLVSSQLIRIWVEMNNSQSSWHKLSTSYP